MSHYHHTEVWITFVKINQPSRQILSLCLFQGRTIWTVIFTVGGAVCWQPTTTLNIKGMPRLCESKSKSLSKSSCIFDTSTVIYSQMTFGLRFNGLYCPHFPPSVSWSLSSNADSVDYPEFVLDLPNCVIMPQTTFLYLLYVPMPITTR